MKERKGTRTRKIKPYGRTYMRRRAHVALDFCPDIYPCRECGNPVVKGYCCTYCNSVDP